MWVPSKWQFFFSLPNQRKKDVLRVPKAQLDHEHSGSLTRAIRFLLVLKGQSTNSHFLVSPTGWWQCPACQWSYPATRGTQFSHWTWYRNTQPMDDRVADISGEATTDGLTWEPHRTFNMALRKTIFELKKPLSNIGKNKNGANSNKNCSKI